MAHQLARELALTQTTTNSAENRVHGNIIRPAIGINSSQISIQVIQPGFVAAIDAPAFDAPLAPETIASIKSAWQQFPVLVFRNQRLDEQALANFSQQLGSFGHDPYVRPTAAHQHVIEVRRDPQETAPIFGHSWHSDWSFQQQPPSATLLQSHILPPHGGDTVFASGYKALETLSSAMQAMLKPLRGIHSATSAYGPNGLFAKDDNTRSMKIVVSEQADQRCAHPLIRMHPESGRQALYINHVYTIGIEGFKQAESSALLGYLFRHMSQQSFTYRHKWQNDTLLMWDNRCVTHYADGGYNGHQRILYRTTLAGEKPIG